jgi:bacterioferritin
MQGDPKVINSLNSALQAELTAANRYWVEAHMLEEWGFKKLARKWRKSKHQHRQTATEFMERVLFLEGIPAMSVDTVSSADSVNAILATALADEMAIDAEYRPADMQAHELMDFVTHDLFTDVLEKTEDRIEWIETQIDLIANIGLQLYSQKKI